MQVSVKFFLKSCYFFVCTEGTLNMSMTLVIENLFIFCIFYFFNQKVHAQSTYCSSGKKRICKILKMHFTVKEDKIAPSCYARVQNLLFS